MTRPPLGRVPLGLVCVVCGRRSRVTVSWRPDAPDGAVACAWCGHSQPIRRDPAPFGADD